MDYSRLTKVQWAWEFLRRNPNYQRDYHWFIQQWHALEKEYGCSPDIDYQAWKQDPRSYKIINQDAEQDGNCTIGDDKLLIECWMGYKWGFFQYPQSPQVNALDLPNGTQWRPLAADFQTAENPCISHGDDIILSIEYDLSRSIKEQLMRAKQKVIIAQRRLKQAGKLQTYTIAGKSALWEKCLQFLDKRDAIINDQLLTNDRGTGNFSSQRIACEANHYVLNYLSILSLMNK